MRRTRSFDPRDRIAGTFFADGSQRRFAILALLIAVCAFTGGSYRGTMPALVLLRPVMVLGIGAMIALPGQWDWQGLRWLAALLAIYALTMIVQLVPLPAEWWRAMPGHGRYAGIVGLAPNAARPISLAPDLTINSLLALLPTVAVLVAFAGMRSRERWNVVWIVLGLCGLNVLVGLIQAAGGSGPAALATRSDTNVVTGLLANRNHGAILLAITLPLVAVVLRTSRFGLWPRWAILCGATLIALSLILLTGSRQGLALGVLALACAATMLFSRKQVRTAMKPLPLALIAGGGLLLIGALTAVAVASGRAPSIDRLGLLLVPADEARFRSFPILLRMTRDFLPFGIGYGAFDPVYRGYEPDAFLHSSYFNRAHNDLLEVVMSGGVPVLLPLLGMVAWVAQRVTLLLRKRPGDAGTLARAAIVVMTVSLLASLVDYPLRTGIMSSVFAIACCWLATVPAPPRRLLSSSEATRRSGRR